MRRYGYNSRLFRDSLDEKRHYKMYKKGKMWLVAGISLFSSSLAYSSLNGVSVKADTVNTTATADTPDASVDSNAAQSASDQSDDQAATPVATQANTASADSAATSATPDSSSKAATPAAPVASTSTPKAASDQTATDRASAPKAASDATATANTAAKSVTQTPAAAPKATVDSATKAAVDATSTKSPKITEYTKEAGQNLIKQATQAQTQVQDDLNQANALADANANDSIPRDDALAALASHQGAEKASVNDAVTSADAIAATDKQTALDNLNKALTVVDNMTNEVEQAGVLLAADKKGVQANVVTNAQNAYEKVSLPSGVNTKLDAYGDLIVTASNDQTFQSVVANLSDNGLIGSFRQVVDPSENATLTISPSSNTTINSDGTATVHVDKIGNDWTTVTLTFSYTGMKNDKFWVIVPKSDAKDFNVYNGASGAKNEQYLTATGKFTADASDANSVKYTWTVDTDGSTVNQQINMLGIGSSHYLYVPADGRLATYVSNKNGATPDGSIIPIIYGGTNLTPKTTKITLTNPTRVTSAVIENEGSGVGQTATDEKAAGENYVYGLRLGVNGRQTIDKINTTVDVPSTFTLNQSLTNQLIAHLAENGTNNVKVTQAGGAGKPITITADTFATGEGAVIDGHLAFLPFVGSYGAGTTGSQTFTIGNLTYTLDGYGDGSGQAPVLKTSAVGPTYSPNTSDGNKTISYTGTKTPLKEFVGNTNNPKLDYVIYGLNAGNQRLIGDSSANVLGRFGLTNDGSTSLNGTLTIGIPTQITSTGVYLPLTSQSAGTLNSGINGYSVNVKFSNGTSQNFTNLKEGTTVSTLPQSGSYNTTQMITVPSGATITGYEITPNKIVTPADVNLVSNLAESIPGLQTDNDLTPGMFGVLGFVNDKATDKQNINMPLSFTNLKTASGTAVPNKVTKNLTVTAVKDAPIKLGENILPNGAGAYNQKNPGDVFGIILGNGNTVNEDYPNLNADGFYVNQTVNGGKYNGTTGNDGGLGSSGINAVTDRDKNDGAPFAGAAKVKVDPVIYVTVPKTTKLINRQTGQPYKISDGLPFRKVGTLWSSVTQTPKITQYTNADKQTVYKIDYSGTGFVWNATTEQMEFDFKVDEDAMSSVLPFSNTTDMDANMADQDPLHKATTTPATINGKTYNVPSATKGGVGGESTAAIMVQGDDQYIGSATLNSQKDANGLFTTLTDASGTTTKVSGLSSFSYYNPNASGVDPGTVDNNPGQSNTLIITAPESLILAGTILSNQNQGTTNYETNGVNSPIVNDQESIRMRLANNTSKSYDKVAGILNLRKLIQLMTLQLTLRGHLS
ncbi:peptidase S8 [Secundilactobacillus pentosiphilus]|uniref:Peptidase S8 n=1 Tax=Secundilactobacillus pentosiphilus TaxID=1714682 RepID=A0A1Z5IX79_9LACO|nr:KxYKxGKxW signal peptide domain-containing protein [Secundilactobacillus pentosiphilus]GAX06410.1 peptidase S8 [Secundilactobacillus pentosiphilus]